MCQPGALRRDSARMVPCSRAGTPPNTISQRKVSQNARGEDLISSSAGAVFLLFCGISVLRSFPLPCRGNRDFHPRVLGIRLCFFGRYSILWFAFRFLGVAQWTGAAFFSSPLFRFFSSAFLPFRFSLFAYLSAAARIRREWGRMAGNGMWEKG